MFRLLLVVLLGGLLSITHVVHQLLEQAIPKSQEVKTHYFLPSPEFLEVIALGHNVLLADILWLQAIQYYGGMVQKNQSMPDLYLYFDAIATLDPHFVQSYIFASFVLADQKDEVHAEKILMKGLEQNPDSWTIPYQIGFVNYLYFKNKLRAARYFEIAAGKKDAPPHLARMAARLYTLSGAQERCQVAPRLWADAYERATEAATKERAQKHLVELKMVCDLIALREAIEAYQKDWADNQKKMAEKKKEKDGKEENVKLQEPPLPQNLEDLVKKSYIKSVPHDPFGRPYQYQFQTGEVKAQPPKWKKWVELKDSDITK